MPAPQVRVLAGFGSHPDDPVQQWTDISADVRGWEGVTWSRGRREVTEHVEPGAASLSLSNPGGRYTYGNAGSDLYPGVRPNVRIRIQLSIDDGATWVDRWDGHASGWPVAWALGQVARDSVVALTCTDRLSRFARARTLGDALAEELGTGSDLGDSAWRLG